MVDPVGARVLPDPVASSPQATSHVSFCQLLAFVFVIGSERVSVATRRLPMMQAVRLQVSFPTWMQSQTRTGWPGLSC